MARTAILIHMSGYMYVHNTNQPLARAPSGSGQPPPRLRGTEYTPREPFALPGVFCYYNASGRSMPSADGSSREMRGDPRSKQPPPSRCWCTFLKIPVKRDLKGPRERLGTGNAAARQVMGQRTRKHEAASLGRSGEDDDNCFGHRLLSHLEAGRARHNIIESTARRKRPRGSVCNPYVQTGMAA